MHVCRHPCRILSGDRDADTDNKDANKDTKISKMYTKPLAQPGSARFQLFRLNNFKFRSSSYTFEGEARLQEISVTE